MSFFFFFIQRNLEFILESLFGEEISFDKKQKRQKYSLSEYYLWWHIFEIKFFLGFNQLQMEIINSLIGVRLYQIKVCIMTIET